MATNGNSDNGRRKGLIRRMHSAPRYVSIPVGVGLILGGTILAPLPIFGVWMFPVGLAILAPHSPGAHRLSRRFHWWSLKCLRWSIRNGFVRIKTKTRGDDQEDASPSEDV
ncbi:hypothetical protein FEV16_12825 [Methylocystis sp. B8]|nr:hypothetical protein FEV16_12825 [Methylocystis sp. B8]